VSKKNIISKIKNLKVEIVISTILIIILSILSVLGAFFIFSVQSEVRSNSEESDLRYRIVNVIEKDINKILEEDKQKQQLALMILQDMYSINELINQSKEYNKTNPGTITQEYIDELALGFVQKISNLNNLIKETNAYNWSIENNATNLNNYTYFGLEYFLVRNNYPGIKETLDSSILYWINYTYFPDDPEILDIDIYNWEGELFSYLDIVLEMGQYTAIHIQGTDLNLSGEGGMPVDYYMLLSDAYWYGVYAETYQQSVEIMTTALILMATAAVIIAFVVSIDIKKYIYISLAVGIIVSIVGIWLFGLAFIYLVKANLFVYWGW